MTRVKSGAHLVQVYKPLFLDGPYSLFDLKRDFKGEFMKLGLKSVNELYK